MTPDELEEYALACINVCDGIVTMDSDQRRGCQLQICIALTAAVEELECTLDDEEAAHAETLRMLNAANCRTGGRVAPFFTSWRAA